MPDDLENTIIAQPPILPAPDSTPEPQTALDIIMAGGPIVMLLIALSVIALTIILYKLTQFLIAGILRKQHIERAIRLSREGNEFEALASVQGAKDPIARTMAVALRGKLRNDVSEAAVREEVERVANSELAALRSHLSILEVIGSLAPLLGLLGTVLGMITAFQAMEAAGRNVDPSALSGGIWAALLTTAAGLLVAIPVVAISTWFDRIIANIADRIESAVTCVFSPDLSHRSERDFHEARPVQA